MKKIMQPTADPATYFLDVYSRMWLPLLQIPIVCPCGHTGAALHSTLRHRVSVVLLDESQGRVSTFHGHSCHGGDQQQLQDLQNIRKQKLLSGNTLQRVFYRTGNFHLRRDAAQTRSSVSRCSASGKSTSKAWSKSARTRSTSIVFGKKTQSSHSRFGHGRESGAELCEQVVKKRQEDRAPPIILWGFSRDAAGSLGLSLARSWCAQFWPPRHCRHFQHVGINWLELLHCLSPNALKCLPDQMYFTTTSPRAR